MSNNEPAIDGPLAGVRVVDLTNIVMGPLATRMLGDMGADVIRVEEPAGDAIRQYAPMRNDRMSAFSINLNRNKRSIVLDLKSESGSRAMRDLLASADVFVTNMRRGALTRLGLDEASVREVREDIIYCVANGFGSDGPRADDAAYDDVIQAASGLAGTFAWVSDEPRLIPSIYADKVTGTHIAFAISSALLGRERSGNGIAIEVPMAETMAAFNLVEHLGGQTFDPPFGGFSYGRVRNVNRRPWPTADGWAVILPYSRANWVDFFTFGDRPDLIDDERFVSAGDRVENAAELYGHVGEIVATKSTAEWIEFCAEHSIPASEVIDLEDIGDDPHFAAVGLLQDDEHPTEGSYRYVRDPIMFDHSHSPLRRPAPRLGQDTDEVMGELGWSADHISELHS